MEEESEVERRRWEEACRREAVVRELLRNHPERLTMQIGGRRRLGAGAEPSDHVPDHRPLSGETGGLGACAWQARPTDRFPNADVGAGDGPSRDGGARVSAADPAAAQPPRRASRRAVPPQGLEGADLAHGQGHGCSRSTCACGPDGAATGACSAPRKHAGPLRRLPAARGRADRPHPGRRHRGRRTEPAEHEAALAHARGRCGHPHGDRVSSVAGRALARFDRPLPAARRL